PFPEQRRNDVCGQKVEQNNARAQSNCETPTAACRGRGVRFGRGYLRVAAHGFGSATRAFGSSTGSLRCAYRGTIILEEVVSHPARQQIAVAAATLVVNTVNCFISDWFPVSYVFEADHYQPDQQ